MRRPATFQQRKIAIIGAAAGFVLFIFTPLSILATPDQRVEACGGRGNQVDAAFRIDAAADFWDYFPAALAAPELAGDPRPAYVIVFGRDFRMPMLHTARDASQQIAQDVVCVITADGVPNLYWDISKAGSTFANP